MQVKLETPDDQSVIASQKNNRKVFVKGKRRLNFGEDYVFEFNGNKYDIFPDSLVNKIDLVFDPLECYIDQLEEMGDIEIEPCSVASIFRALVCQGKRDLYDWEKGAEQHIGKINIFRISYNNKFRELKPGTKIAVELTGPREGVNP